MVAWRDVNALYQIYPRSFRDADGDGVGDLRGIIDKLDYLKGAPQSLGTDAIWISPFFASPMKDFGYDVSNYCDVDPLFGSLVEFDELLAKAHARDIRVMIDFVPNHTSDQHAWFQEAKKGRDSAYRNYYVWRDPAPDGGVPNNWLSSFAGSAWEYDELSGQYYLHSFLKEQPDLNWENPVVREEMKNVLRFWLQRGVDGIRADAVWCLSKDRDFQDNPRNPSYFGDTQAYGSFIHRNSKNGPRLYEYLSELTDTVGEFSDRRILFEYYADSMIGDPFEQFRPFYLEAFRGIGMPFNFEGIHQQWGAEPFGGFINRFQALLREGDVPVYCFGNHDQPRIATRYGRQQSRLIAMMELTLPGMPTVYYGDEIGMQDGQITPEQVRDPSAGENGMGGRDPQRTPMQWTNDSSVGFTSGAPWLPVASFYQTYNVQSELYDQHSFLTLYRALLELRREEGVMAHGDFSLVSTNDNVLVYERSGEGRRYIVALNFGDQPVAIRVPHGEIRVATHVGDVLSFDYDGALRLQGYGGAIIDLR